MKNNKKGLLTVTEFGLLILAVLTLAALAYVLIFQHGAGLQKAGTDVEGLKKLVPDTTPEELPATKIELPPEHLAAIKSLRDAINKMLSSDKKNCFVKYDPIPNLGLRGTSIEFHYENGQTTMLVYGGADGRKLIPELATKFDKMIPCVVAGSDQVAENFFSKFIEGKDVSGNYFQPVNYVRILGCGDEINRIMTVENDDPQVHLDHGPNRYCNNLNDGGILFSPDNQRICFIPTAGNVPMGQDGIDQDYVSGEGDGSLALQFSNGAFKGGATKC